MKKFIPIFYLTIILSNQLFAQTVTLGASISYKGSFKENTFTSYSESIKNILMFGGTVYSQPFNNIPIVTGMDFSLGNKIVLNYMTTKTPDGYDNSAKREIELMVIEVPILYKFYQNDLLSLLFGGKIGLDKTTLNEHFMSHDYKNSSTKLAWGISSGVEIKLPSSFLVGGFLNYRYLKNKIIDFREYDFTGLWFNLKVLYNI